MGSRHIKSTLTIPIKYDTDANSLPTCIELDACDRIIYYCQNVGCNLGLVLGFFAVKILFFNMMITIVTVMTERLITSQWEYS